MASALGLDIGGANLKAAHSDGAARLVPFPVWKNPAGLAGALRDLIRSFPPVQRMAVTMTAELCDCFTTKREGVHAILDAVQESWGPNFHTWSTAGHFLERAEARTRTLEVAAANWHALATFVGHLAPKGPALLIDVGSTTTDIIPILNGQPVPRGKTDPERLGSGELVYTGVRRTPLCAILCSPFAAEFFATTLDVFLVLGQLPEDLANRETADGRPATVACARARLARMLCGDPDTLTNQEIDQVAKQAQQRQLNLFSAALERVAASLPDFPATCVLSGSGEFLARMVLEEITTCPRPCILSLRETLGPELSDTACAYALSVLMKEQLERMEN